MLRRRTEVEFEKINRYRIKKRIEKRKEELDMLLALEQERIQARQSKLGAFLESKYAITTIPELEHLLSPLFNKEEV